MNYSDVVDGSEESSDESDEDPAEETEKVRQKRVACWRPRPTASTSADQLVLTLFLFSNYSKSILTQIVETNRLADIIKDK